MSDEAGNFIDRNWSDEPQAIFGSNPELVQEVYAFEKNIEKMFNTEFLTDAGAIPTKYYHQGGDASFIDILAPGQYWGEDVYKWWTWIGPQFVGTLYLRNMRIYAKGTNAFVYMNQVYQGDHEGEKFFWAMRQTDVLEKVESAWKIMHTHLSYAVDPVELDPSTWRIDFEYKARPQPWEAAAEGAGYGETPDTFTPEKGA